MRGRIDSIDILRGFAVLQMIFWQTFDFFARANIYLDMPYYNSIFNMPVHTIGAGFFVFITGISAYISVSRKLDKNVGKLSILLHTIKRYGGYILFSLIFTTFVFGFKTFYIWNEAIQGLGFAALIAVLIILLSRSKWVFACLGLILIIAQPFLRRLLENDFIYQNFPYDAISAGIFSNGVSIFLNSTVRGFFSLSHILPMTLFGVFLSILIVKLKKNTLIKTSLIAGSLITLVSLLLHLSFIKIHLFNRSPSSQLFLIGTSFLFFGLIEYSLFKFKKGKIFDFLKLFGKTAIVAYLFHFVLIYKPLKILNVESALGAGASYVLAVISVIIIYYACKTWLQKKDLIFKMIPIKNFLR